jgi:hypothetical protein
MIHPLIGYLTYSSTCLEYYDKLAYNYVHYIASLPNVERKYVLNVYPPPFSPEKIKVY